MNELIFDIPHWYGRKVSNMGEEMSLKQSLCKERSLKSKKKKQTAGYELYHWYRRLNFFPLFPVPSFEINGTGFHIRVHIARKAAEFK